MQQQQQPAGSTSWAAAAGKGLPPSEPSATGQMNGATNKQLEQLNSVREALFSQVNRHQRMNHMGEQVFLSVIGGGGVGGGAVSKGLTAVFCNSILHVCTDAND